MYVCKWGCPPLVCGRCVYKCEAAVAAFHPREVYVPEKVHSDDLIVALLLGQAVAVARIAAGRCRIQAVIAPLVRVEQSARREAAASQGVHSVLGACRRARVRARGARCVTQDDRVAKAPARARERGCAASAMGACEHHRRTVEPSCSDSPVAAGGVPVAVPPERTAWATESAEPSHVGGAAQGWPLSVAAPSAESHTNVTLVSSA